MIRLKLYSVPLNTSGPLRKTVRKIDFYFPSCQHLWHHQQNGVVCRSSSWALLPRFSLIPQSIFAPIQTSNISISSKKKLFLAFPTFFRCIGELLCMSEEMNPVFLIIFPYPFASLESYIVNKTRKCSHKLLTFEHIIPPHFSSSSFLLLVHRCCFSLSSKYTRFCAAFPVDTFRAVSSSSSIPFPSQFPFSSLVAFLCAWFSH